MPISQARHNMTAPNVSHNLGDLRSELNHADELADSRRILEAKHNREFEALRLFWDKDREELRKTKEELLKLREENEGLKGKIDAVTGKIATVESTLHEKLQQQCNEFLDRIEAEYTKSRTSRPEGEAGEPWLGILKHDVSRLLAHSRRLEGTNNSTSELIHELIQFHEEEFDMLLNLNRGWMILAWRIFHADEENRTKAPLLSTGIKT